MGVSPGTPRKLTPKQEQELVQILPIDVRPVIIERSS
jgi:transposase